MSNVHEQAPPIPAQGDTWLLVIQEMEERRKLGIAKYGVPVQPQNGRNNLVDAYQELLDLIVYLRNELAEKEKVQKELEALKKFKAFVHYTLDSMSVPVDPPGEHRDAGCRIGQRLEWIATRIHNLRILAGDLT